MKKFSKRALSLFLSILMVVTMLPTFALTASAKISATYQKHYLYGNADSITVNGGAYYNAEYKALEIGSSGKYGVVNVQELFQNTTKEQGFTISFRAKADSNCADTGRYFTINSKYGYASMNWNNDAKTAAYVDWYSSNNSEIAGARNPNTYYYSNDFDGNSSSKGAWHIFTMTVDNTSVKRYVDGVLKDTITCNTNEQFFTRMSDSANTQLIIGGTSWANDTQFSGYVGQINLYNKVLSADEVALDKADIEKNYNEYLGPISGTLTKNATGIVVSGTEGRWKSSMFQLVNDQEKNNTSCGIIKYDISSIKDKSVQSATLNYNINSWGDDVTPGLTVYYSTSISDSKYINNSGFTGTNWTCGSGTIANNSFATGLGFSTSNVFATITRSSTATNTNYTTDVKTALQKALDENKDTLYIFIMHTSAGGQNKAGTPESGTGDKWTDTNVNPTTFTIDYTVKEKERTESEVNTALTNANIAVDAWSKKRPSTGNVKVGSTVVPSSGNVLYSQNATDWSIKDNLFSSPNGTVASHYASYRINYYIPATTFIYDGTSSDFYTTVLIGIKRKDSGCKHVYVNNIYPTTGYLALKETWKGYIENFNYPTSDNWQIGYASDKWYGTNAFDNTDTIRAFRNKLYYTGTPASTLTEIPSTTWFSHSDCEPASTLGTRNTKDTNRQAQGTNTIDNPIAIIDVATIESIASDLKAGKVSAYNVLKSNPKAFTSTSAYDYLEAVKNLASFNVLNYFSSSTNNYIECAAKIDELVFEYNKALNNLEIASYTATIQNNAGQSLSVTQPAVTMNGSTYTQAKWNISDKITQLTTANVIGSSPSYSHKVYNWENNVNGQNITDDVTVTEIKTEGACTWNAGEITKQANCKEDGNTRYTCTVCGATKDVPITSAGDHNWTEWANNNSYSTEKHYRYCEGCNEYQYDPHNSDIVLPRVEPTCTETGLTEGNKCSVCGKVITAQIEIPANGHTEQTVIENNVNCDKNGNATSCTEAGTYDLVVYCSVCHEELSREQKNVSALGHDYTDVAYVQVQGEDKHQRTCKRDGCVSVLEENCEFTIQGDTTDPTCTKDGYVTYSCVCGREYKDYSEGQSATGHTTKIVYKNITGVVVENGVPTDETTSCTVDGSYDKYVVCTVEGCDNDSETLDGQKIISQEHITVTALGHNAGDVVVENKSNVYDDLTSSNCTTNGSYDNVTYCTRCKEQTSREIVVVPARGHNMTPEYVKSNCTEDGYYTLFCAYDDCDYAEDKHYSMAGFELTEYDADATQYISWHVSNQANSIGNINVNQENKRAFARAYIVDVKAPIDSLKLSYTTDIDSAYIGTYDHFWFEDTANADIPGNRLAIDGDPSKTTHRVRDEKHGITHTVDVPGNSYTLAASLMKGSDELIITGIKVTPALPDGWTDADRVATGDTDATKHDYSTVKVFETSANVYEWKNVCSRDESHVSADVIKTIYADAHAAAVETANAKLTETDKYTAESLATLQTALDSNKTLDVSDASEMTQEDVNDKIDAILTAISELKLKSYTYKVVYYDVDGNPIANEENQQATVEYGTEVKLTANDSYSVIKWVATYEDKDIPDVKVAEIAKSIKAVIKSNVEFSVTVNDISKPVEENTYAVSLYNRTNKLADIAYIAQNIDNTYDVSVDLEHNAITVGGKTLTAPEVVFYDVTGFEIDGEAVTNGVVTISSDTDIKTIYKPSKNDITITCDDTCTSSVTTAYWNQRVVVTANEGNANTKWLVNNQVVAYGPTYSFIATANATITCVNEAELLPVATILSLGYGSIRAKTISAVCSYYVPEGYTFVEAGVLLKTSAVNNNAAVNNVNNYTGADGTTVNAKAFKATEFVNSTRQYVINVSSTKDYNSLYVGAVAYVVAEKDGVKTTYYSPLTNSNYEKPSQNA